MLALAVLVLSLGQVKAQPCRPTVACTAELVPAGHVEAELGGFATGAVGAFNVLAKVSLRDWLQVQLGSDNFFVGDGGPLRVLDGANGALKARLLSQAGWVPTVSLSTRLVVPTRTVDFPAVQRSLDWAATAHVSKDLGPLHVDLNGTFLLFGGKEAQGQGALAFSTGLPAGFGAALEVHSTFGNARLANDGGVRGVLTWSPVDQLVIDVGGDVGFFPQTRAWAFFAGFVFVPTG